MISSSSWSQRDPHQQEFPPLLFSLDAPSLAPGGGGTSVTPRTQTPHRRGDGDSISMGTRGRSATPGSVQTEATPPTPPPPVARLGDDVTMEDPSTSDAARRPPPQPMQSLYSPMGPDTTSSQQQQMRPWGGGGYEPAPAQYQDVWVTIFGIGPGDTQLVLKEFSKCGDILQWGSFGVTSANYIHVQFQSKYSAQRALLRSGEQFSPSLIVGVKPLDPRHRLAIEEYLAGGGGGGNGGVGSSLAAALGPQALALERPYKFEAGLPLEAGAPGGGRQAPRTMVSKIFEYVLGF